MSIHRELDYTAKIRSITRVEFGILSPEEIIKRSVAHVHKTTLYENNGEPTVGGLFDPRMGVIDRGKLCKTCHLDRTFCTGHAGHIELVKPVFQFQYIYIILRFLKSICLFCNKSLIDINSPYVRSIINSCGDDNQKLFMEMTELASKRKLCGKESDTDTLGNPLGCGLTQPSKYQKVEFKIFAEWKVGKNDKKDKEERKLNLTPEKISTLFAKIPREDAAIFGFSENWCLPHWLITNVLPVSPPSVRPSVRQYNNQRSEDDLTIKYIDIIKYNNILKKKLHSGSSKDTIGYYFLCLQFHVATLIDNESQSKTAVTRASNRPLRTYKQRLHSKDGRIRGNLMGKRVDFSARSVITPDPNISIDQLGVPEEIAMNLTSPEKVNRYNYHKLYKLILNGAHKYPGVKKIKKLSDGKTFTLEFCDNPKTLKEIADNLEEGDTVHRHLMDDDYVLFNRQPSLHKMSMMAHRVVVMKHSTFRLNVSATGPYNADFDGDEMNMHVPQSLQSAIELREIAAIPKQIISPANSEPIIVPVQDTLIGLYKITGDGVKFNRREAMSLLSKVTTFDGELPAPSIEGRDGQKRFWTGHQLVSLILPEINLKMENSAEKEVEIVQGKFLKGQVDKSISKKIVHIIFNDFGPKSAQTYLDNLQNMMTAYLIREGFSVGVGDLMVDQRVKGVIRKIIDKGAGKVNAIHHDIHQGTFSDLSFSTNSDAYEHRIRLIVGEIERDIENLVIKTAKDNRILQAILSGSKGTTFHFRSMVGIVGSQAVDGKRIPFGFSERTRSLPHFYKYDDGLIPKGFVTHSFIDGLSPEEFFFHAMGGREGLIDTAVKSVTAETPVVLIEDGKAIYTKIGTWIDNHMTKKASSITLSSEYNMESLDLTENVLIPTMDYQGHVSWGKLTSVTRHDPGEVLYKISTLGGRSVTVTASKSLLVWNKNIGEFRETLTDQIEVGDYLPTTTKLPIPPQTINSIDMTNYFPKTSLDSFLISDKFELNYENGQFIGLFLATGTVCANTNATQIINQNHDVTEFVQKWFDVHSIKHSQFDNVDEYGRTGGTQGHSNTFASFLNKFVGNESKNKYIPDEAFIAPDIFVKGLLSGYFSGDGCISRNSIEISSSSPRLIEGISMLCSRLGIFAKISVSEVKMEKDNCISIRAQWAKLFHDQIKLIDDKKQKSIESMTYSEKHINFESLTDIVKDKIVSIKKVDPKDHPKMYDVTVPGTFNFGLANGLQVRDTAESGYIQRRLVKGLEDLKVHYDHTVRSAIGDIYQFIYGEDAINGSGLLEKQGLKFLYWPYNKISDSYRFSASDKWELFMTEDAVNRMKKTTDWKDRLDSNFKELIESRDYLVRDVFKYNYETKIVAPLNLQRLIDNIKAKFNLNTQLRSNLTPFDVEEELKLLYADLQTNGHPHKVLISMIKFYFAPKQLIKKYRFNKSALSYMMNYLRSKYQQTRVDPGEMVGPLAAQSIGEISTQLTLNTFHTAGKASTVTTGGVARLKELMANSKKIKSPSIVVYLDEEYSQDKAKALNLLHNLELTTIENIISSVSLYLDTNNDTNIDADKALIDIYKLFGEITDQVKDDNPWILRIKFNRAEMMERNISMNDLYLIIQQNFANVNCIYTDDNSGELIMRLKLEFDSDDNNADNDIRKMKEFEQKIVSTVVKGIPEISHVTMDSVKERVALTEGNVYTPVEERILITQGSNLREVLSQEHVDPNRTRSNDINEMLAMFGIEAARNTIIDEFSALVGSVSYRHVGLLADFMTHKGYIMPIDRHGINRGNAGPLAKSSFEETIEQLLQAGVFGKVDNMLGVSANIMMGHITPAGTGFPKVFLDEKMISDELKNRPVQPKLEKMSDQEVVDKFMNISEFCQDGVGINFDLDNIPDDKVKLDHIPIVEIE